MTTPRNMVDYEETYAEFEIDVPERFNFARDVFDRWAEDPERLALWWIDDDGAEEKRTFAELAESSRRAASALAARGIGRGNRVMIVLPRLIEWWIVKLACLRLGAVSSPGTVQLMAKDFRDRLRDSGAACIVTEPESAARVDQVIDDCPHVRCKILVGGERDGWIRWEELLDGASPGFETADTRSDEAALLFFTSGTTGRPKMALHTHASYPLGHRITGRFWLDLDEDDLHWNLSDTGWAKAAWSSFYGPWNLGATVFVHHAPRFDARRTLEILSGYPITTLCAAPTIYRYLVIDEEFRSFRSAMLRHCVAAGEPLNPEVIETWKRQTGLTIRDGYGQTETVLIVGSFPCLEPRIGSMGRPAPGFDVRIIDEGGDEVPPDTEGDIAVRVEPERPVGLFKEYWKEPDRTEARFRDGWYLTGDRARRDADGYLWFVGRADDVILSAGYRIGPFEVESALIEHEDVAEAAVVSSPDEIRGEVVKAYVVLRDARSGDEELLRELQDHVKRTTAPYKYPRKIEFVDSLPQTVSGKIRRAELRAREWERGGETED